MDEDHKHLQHLDSNHNIYIYQISYESINPGDVGHDFDNLLTT